MAKTKLKSQPAQTRASKAPRVQAKLKAWRKIIDSHRPKLEAAWDKVEGLLAEDRGDPVAYQRRIRRDRRLP